MQATNKHARQLLASETLINTRAHKLASGDREPRRRPATVQPGMLVPGLLVDVLDLGHGNCNRKESRLKFGRMHMRPNLHVMTPSLRYHNFTAFIRGGDDGNASGVGGDPAIAAGGGHPDPHDQSADPPQGGAGGSISVVLGRGPLTGVRGGDGGNASGVGGDAAATAPEPPPNDIEWVTVVDNLNNQSDIHDYGPRYQNFERRWWRHIHALWPGFPPPDNSAVTQIRRTPAARTAARTAWQRRNPERHKWAVKVNNTFYFKCVR